MKVEVIKNKSASKAFLRTVFPKGNLDCVTRTCTISVDEFAQLWANTEGFAKVGNQFSNMNQYNYLFAVNEDALSEFASTHVQVICDTITETQDFGWVTHSARACGSSSRKTETKPLNKSFTAVYRRRFKYGSSDNCCKIIARKSVCGQYVTVFES